VEPQRTEGAVPGTAGTGRVVVGLDGSAGARTALVWGVVEAARRGTDVQVVTAFAADYYWTDAYLFDPQRLDTARTDTEARARKVVDEVRGDEYVAAAGASAVEVDVTVVAGAAADQLVDIATPDDLLVLGSRGRGAVKGAVLGSVALRCVMHGRGPVVVVPHGWSPRAGSPATVVVGFDASPAARLALTAGLGEAGLRGARVEVVTAFETAGPWVDLHAAGGRSIDEAREVIQAQASQAVADAMGGALGPNVEVLAVEGPPAAALVSRSRDADLVVIGSRGHATLPGLVLGSVALRTVARASCPVMVVHPRAGAGG
jgi:nucleotide-binding universal stress UspA family protein